jgi:hypothetical protein
MLSWVELGAMSPGTKHAQKKGSMPDTFRVDAKSAVATSWSDGLALALELQQPESLELVGQWDDLSAFAGVVDSVRSLRLSGAESDGRVRSLAGLDCFVGLRSLSLANRVENGLENLAAVPLESLYATAQPGLMDCLSRSNIRQLSLVAADGALLETAQNRPKLSSLSLIRPKLADLRPLAGFDSLNTLNVSHGSHLLSLNGIEALPLEHLVVETAKRLTDLVPLHLVLSLRSLRLVAVAKGARHPCLSDLKALEVVHLGGKEFGAVDWGTLLTLPRLVKVFAPWDPAVIERLEMEQQLPAKRRFRTFDPAGARGVRMLFIEIE